MSDADTALSILNKIAADASAAIILETWGAAFDTGWVDLDEPELDLLRRLGEAADA